MKTKIKSYVLDPHTITCLKTLEIYNLKKPLVIFSTAECTKFAPTMQNAMGDDEKIPDEMALKSFAKELLLN